MAENFQDENRTVEEILSGLRQPQKSLPCKLFYDDNGSRLFGQICLQPEYYPTRTEIEILRKHGQEMADMMGPSCLVIEPGSGMGEKTRVLLGSLLEPAGYIPIEISSKTLYESVAGLQRDFPDLHIQPLAMDYTLPLEIPHPNRYRRIVAFFPGSTIGNFTPEHARKFIGQIARMVGKEGGLLIGVDLKKDSSLLSAAYNDQGGVTAKFNLNILHHVNRITGANFRIDCWRHQAHYNAGRGRIEMHLVSMEPQTVTISGQSVSFERAETILTEYAYKYSLDEFAALGEGLFTVRRVWTDPRDLFSIQFLEFS